MSDEKLFTSTTDPAPGIRGDLTIMKIENNGQPYLYFHDTLGYATPNFALNQQVAGLLSLLNGQRSIEDIMTLVNSGGEIDTGDLVDFVKLFDEHRILYSDYFKEYKAARETEFEEQSYRQPSCIHSSYPAEPAEIRSLFDEAFDKVEESDGAGESGNGKIRALYAPHIDLRVGMDSYAQSFSQLRNLKPKRVVLLATSHYAGYYPDLYSNKPFIASRKTFGLPLGDLRADQEVLDAMEENKDELGISFHDRAHRVEHSIELHLILLRYLWDHEFEIVPVLAGNFDELYYMPDGHLGEKVAAFGRFMNERFGEDEDTLFLISGDLAHVGKKFGDEDPAHTRFEEVRRFDEQFMQHAEKSDRSAMLEHISKNHDPHRICGFPPLYTFLSCFDNLKGRQLTYDLWDERERESAVSYGSVVYEER